MAGFHSSTVTQVRENRVIYRALAILKSRMREPNGLITSPQDVRAFLRLLLEGEQREAFSTIYLDVNLGLIEAEIPFYGTLTMCSVYPREIVRRALHHNAAAVIFAHNHPSGLSDPSRHDMELTCGLIDALKLVDVKVLDHFVVADSGIFSFAEHGILGQRELSQECSSTPGIAPTKNRDRQRKGAENGVHHG